MRKGGHYFLAGLGLSAFCAMGVYIFGAPTTGGQPIKFAALVIAAVFLMGYGIFVLSNDFWRTTGRTLVSSASTSASPDPQRNFGRKQATNAATVDNPFHFEHFDRYSYVDQINKVRMRLDSAPDYQFALLVESLPDAHASREGRTTYFKFFVSVDQTYRSAVYHVSAAFPETPFEPDFPARSEMLLDVILPMVCEVYSRLSGSPIREYGPIPEKLRSRLRERQSYLWRRPGGGMPTNW
jgi:hypothetical protein